MNALDGYTISGKQNGLNCVCGQDTVTRDFTIVMRELGDVNVSISVSSE